MCTHVVARKAAIILKISVSLFEVSSNPGVSMRMIFRPSRVNSSASWTSYVHDSNSFPTRRLEPLVRLINLGYQVSFLSSFSNVRCLQMIFRFLLHP